ncbi:MAG: MotA/TolQ/ExbB proton channel family protein [Pseudomonadota bacterium]
MPIRDLLDALPADFTHFLDIGGPVVWIHLAMSVVLVAIVLLKLWQFLRCGVLLSWGWRRTERAIRDYEHGALKAHSPPRRRDRSGNDIVNTALHLSQHVTVNDTAFIDEMRRLAEGYVGRLRAQLRTVELIATLAPLLGLLGTVLGMIEAFQAMQAAGQNVDPSILSGGIWKALLTTAVGLIVAVPAVIVHSWLERSVDSHMGRVSDAVGRVLTARRLSVSQPQD